jgi:hypothetical protein
MRDKFYFFYDVDDGSMTYTFVYEVIFSELVTRTKFQEVMKEAKNTSHNYSALNDDKFCKAHSIISFREIRSDYQDYREDDVR